MQHKLRIAWVAIGLAVLQTGCASQKVQEAQKPRGEVTPLVGTFKVHQYELKNGLDLLVVENHSAPTFAYETWFRVGSRDEDPGYTGLAHLFEHMMFKGTVKHPDGQFDRLLEAGAEGVNAFTDRDYTAYVQELPKGKLELIASLEADRMVHLVVNEHSFRTELQVIQNERRYRNENSPDGTMEQELFGLAFKRHPYHWPVIGYQEDLDRMSAADPVRFYRSHYNPAHATVLVVGDVQADHVRDVIEKYYGNLSAVPSPVRIVAEEPAQKRPRQKTIRLNIQVEKLLMGFRVPPLVSPQDPSLEVLAAVLAEGNSSRLYRALVNTGLADSVDADNPENKDSSLFLISVNMQKGKRAALAEAVIRKELLKLAENPISEQELTRAKNQLSFDFYSEISSNSDMAKSLGFFETVANSFEKSVELRQAILKVTPRELQQVVQEYFGPANRTAIIGLPKGAER